MELVYNSEFCSIYQKDGKYYKVLNVASGTAKVGDVFVFYKKDIVQMILAEGYLYSTFLCNEKDSSYSSLI